jgi:hypothetical protein
MGVEIVRYRAPHARVAVAYGTKDRVEQTRITVAPLLDAPDIDLYWFDGSATDPGRRLPFELCPTQQRPQDVGPADMAICEVHLGVVGGPDCAILYALQTLRQRSYELVILIENDVLLSDGWYGAMRGAIERAEAAGFKVGAATARVFAQRVLSFNDDHCLMLNSGAGCIALRPEAIDILLAHYRTLDAQEFFRHVRWLTGIDASATMDIAPTQRLCVDFIFDLILYLHGYVVAAPPTTFARTIDEPALAAWPVTSTGDHLQVTHARITRPEQIRTVPYRFFRFQRSPQSDRLLLGCHQLHIGVNSLDLDAPVRARGNWRRTWRQFLGPFGLLGAGEISVQPCGLTTGLLFRSGDTPLRIFLSGSDGSRSPEYVLEPSMTIDFPLWEADDRSTRTRSLHVASGEICLIGLTVHAAALAQYALGQPSIDHLPP